MYTSTCYLNPVQKQSTAWACNSIALPIGSLHDVASTSTNANGRCLYIQFDSSLIWQMPGSLLHKLGFCCRRVRKNPLRELLCCLALIARHKATIACTWDRQDTVMHDLITFKHSVISKAVFICKATRNVMRIHHCCHL